MRALTAAAITAAALLLSPAPAAAQSGPGDVVSVRNLDQNLAFISLRTGRIATSFLNAYSLSAQRFSTGGTRADRFLLREVGIVIFGTNGNPEDIYVAIHDDASGSPASAALATLTGPARPRPTQSRTPIFYTASDAVTLVGGSTYFIVITTPDTAGDNNYQLDLTNQGGEDSGTSTGWTIADVYHYQHNLGNWIAFGPRAVRMVIRAAIPPPMANAEADANVQAGATVMLNGSATGNGITYSWRQNSGPVNVMLSGANTARPRFTAPTRTVNSALVFELTVTDAIGRTAADTVTVNVAASAALVSAVAAAVAAEADLGIARMQLTAATSTLSDARMQLADVNADLVTVRGQLNSVNAEIARLRGAAGMEAAIAAALAAAVVQRVDINNDGVVDADDFLIAYYAGVRAAELGSVQNGVFVDVPDGASNRARLLGGMRGSFSSSDTDLQMLLQRANALRAAAAP